MIICSECKFFKPPRMINDPNALGECRFDPPRVATDPTQEDRWPFVAEKDWRGKAEPDVKS